MEVEATIEAIGDGAEVALGVLAVAKGMVGTAEAAFYVAEDRIYPVEHGQLLGFASANNRGLMHTAGVGDTGKTGQPIGDDGALRAQRSTGPLGDRLAREAR